MARKRTKPSAPGKGNLIRIWREQRGLTLEALAELVRDRGEPITSASLSRIERGVQPYEQRKLEAIADALQREPADLIMRGNLSAEQAEIWSIVCELGPEEQEQALRVIRALAKREAAPPRKQPVSQRPRVAGPLSRASSSRFRRSG